MKFCPNCGAKLEEGVKFCMECGIKVIRPEPPAYDPPAEPVYAPPESSEPPVKPAYIPQSLAKGGTGPEEKPKEKKPANKKWLLFAGIGAAVILVLILLIALLSGGGNKENLGVYPAVSCETDGGSVDVSGEWIELKKSGKAVLFLMDQEFSCKWSLDDNRFTLKQGGDTYTGSLENGTLTLNLTGMTYTFTKRMEGVTYKAVSCVSGGQNLDEESMDLIGGCYVVLGEDGEGILYLFGEQAAITYNKKELRLDGQSMPYDIKGDTMTFTYPDGTVFELVESDEDPAKATLADDGWNAEAWEEDPDMISELEEYLNWPGKTPAELDLGDRSLTVETEWGNAVVRFMPDGVVGEVDLYIHDCTYEALRAELEAQYGKPTSEGEEPYVESNGGVVRFAWFDHPAGSQKLSAASEYNFIRIIVKAK